MDIFGSASGERSLWTVGKKGLTGIMRLGVKLLLVAKVSVGQSEKWLK